MPATTGLPLISIPFNQDLALNIGREIGLESSQLGGFVNFVSNQLMTRQDLINRLIDPRRDLDDECGFPKFITPDMYQRRYERDPIAARVVEIMSKEAFKVNPNVYEDEDKELTPWEEAWKEMLGGLAGRKSYFEDESGSLLWNYFQEADIKASVGRYGCILFGLDDNKPLDKEVVPRKGMKLKYLRTFTEQQAKITSVVTDASNPRFGQPIYYTITFSDPAQYRNDIDIGVGTVERLVHWTRILHVCKTDIYHTPELQQVFNNLLGLEKLYASSPEMYYKGAFPGISFETDASLGGDVDVDMTKAKDMAEKYMNGLSRYLALNGFTAKSLAPQVVDPTPQIKVQLEAVTIRKGTPMRIFMGTERGSLASTQDTDEWNSRVSEYRHSYVTPRMIAPFVDRMILFGVLPEPQKTLHCYWPDPQTLTDEAKAAIANKLALAIGAYVAQGGEAVLTHHWFLTKILGFTDEEATAAVDDMITQQETEQVDNPETAPSPVPTDGNPPAVPPSPSANGNGKPAAAATATPPSSNVPSVGVTV